LSIISPVLVVFVVAFGTGPDGLMPLYTPHLLHPSVLCHVQQEMARIQEVNSKVVTLKNIQFYSMLWSLQGREIFLSCSMQMTFPWLVAPLVSPWKKFPIW
jgi:hypothetical protein